MKFIAIACITLFSVFIFMVTLIVLVLKRTQGIRDKVDGIMEEALKNR